MKKLLLIIIIAAILSIAIFSIPVEAASVRVIDQVAMPQTWLPIIGWHDCYQNPLIIYKTLEYTNGYAFVRTESFCGGFLQTRTVGTKYIYAVW